MSKYKRDAVSALVSLLQIESAESAPLSGAPFGAVTRECLDAALRLCRALGFLPVDVDGYAGYVELDFGAAETVGVLCHLDVVPVGGGWTHGQGEITLENGEQRTENREQRIENRDGEDNHQLNNARIWGRGATDDKGPFVACLFALCQIRDEGKKLDRNLRLIFGCGEETGSRDMAYYKAHCKVPTLGFSPDSAFPLVAVEKTILHYAVTLLLPDFIKELTAGTRVNVVPGEAKVTRADGVVYTFCGKPAHAMEPEKGDNALWKAAEFMNDKLQASDERLLNSINNEQFSRFLQLLSPNALDILGINISDEISGGTTVNVGTARTEGNAVTFELDFRCSLALLPETVTDALERHLGKRPLLTHRAPCLRADLDGELVKKLMKVYLEHRVQRTENRERRAENSEQRTENGDGRDFNDELQTPDKWLSRENLKNQTMESRDSLENYNQSSPNSSFINRHSPMPLVSGGGTYARSMPNFVAFGPELPGIDNRIHDHDEFLDVAHLDFLIDIYAAAMKELGTISISN